MQEDKFLSQLDVLRQTKLRGLQHKNIVWPTEDENKHAKCQGHDENYSFASGHLWLGALGLSAMRIKFHFRWAWDCSDQLFTAKKIYPQDTCTIIEFTNGQGIIDIGYQQEKHTAYKFNCVRTNGWSEDTTSLHVTIIPCGTIIFDTWQLEGEEFLSWKYQLVWTESMNNEFLYVVEMNGGKEIVSSCLVILDELLYFRPSISKSIILSPELLTFAENIRIIWIMYEEIFWHEIEVELVEFLSPHLE